MTEKTDLHFDIPRNANASIIKVIGVGGGGGNAVNHMYRQGIRGVDFIVCNTDAQALETSPVPVRIQLGVTLTEGRGAGAIPEKGKNAAIENIEEVKNLLKENTKMVFITAGMGGGTGTGAAPVIAAAARDLGILTVGIVTIPFTFEGKKRRMAADEGMNQLRKNVDTLLVISNDKLREIFGNLGITAAFAQADNVLTTAAKGIAEIITAPGHINTDFADVYTVMKDGGIALMGSASADGADRAMRALREALSSPLLNDSSIHGAKQILVNIAFGEDISMDELGELMDYMQEEAGWDANVIMGTSIDETLGGRVNVTLVATGIEPMEEDKPRVVIPMASTEANHPQVADAVKSIIPESVKSPTAGPVVAEAPQWKDDEGLVRDAGNRPELQMTLTTKNENESSEKMELDENLRRSKERLENLRNLSTKIKAPSSISELESTPAFRRRNITMENVPPSSETTISRYSLFENPEDKSIEIRPDNKYLKGNVD